MEFVIKEYINKLTEEDIRNYAMSQGIALKDEETKVLYMYVKNYWHDFYRGNNKELFAELKEKLRPIVYDAIVDVYNEYRGKYL